MGDNSARIEKWRIDKINEWKSGGKLRTRFPKERAFFVWMSTQIEKALKLQQDASLKTRSLRDKLWPTVHTLIPDSSGLKGVPKDWKEFFKETKSELTTMKQRVVSDMLTWPLTFSNAVEQFFSERKQGEIQELHVHLLGFSATVEGDRFELAFSLLQYLLPESRFPKIVIHCVGPEAIAQKRDNRKKGKNKTSSKKVSSKHSLMIGKHIQVFFHKSLYHKYLAADATSPQLAIAFNSGMWCVDAREKIDGSRWSETIEILLERKILTVLTARSRKEMNSCIRVFGNEYILKGQPDFSKRTFLEYPPSRLIPGNVKFMMKPTTNPYGSQCLSHIKTEPGARNLIWAAIAGRES
mmetsp:Transcript_21458/g.31914  ORF Transcript_21458/g.31914 Transcript_21458/m.31914 type:complete len:353 (+) Transcript_21458:102-1160(+)